MSDDSENRVTSWMPTDVKEEMDDRVDWRNSSRSEWIKEAVEYRLAVERALEIRGRELPTDADERADILREIASAGIAECAHGLESTED